VRLNAPKFWSPHSLSCFLKLDAAAKNLANASAGLALQILGPAAAKGAGMAKAVGVRAVHNIAGKVPAPKQIAGKIDAPPAKNLNPHGQPQGLPDNLQANAGGAGGGNALNGVQNATDPKVLPPGYKKKKGADSGSDAPKGIPSDADLVTAQGGFIRYGALDELGRPTQIQARITQDMIGTGSAASRNIQPPGFITGARGSNRARGHLLGEQLGGSGREARNLVTLQQNPANSPRMRDFETAVRQAVEGGQVVEYTVTPIYNLTGRIPQGVTLSARGSGGFHLDVTILNPPGM